MCPIKEDLYRNLSWINRFFCRDGFSHEYMTCVDTIKEHIRSGHDGQPCPDGNY